MIALQNTLNMLSLTVVIQTQAACAVNYIYWLVKGILMTLNASAQRIFHTIGTRKPLSIS